MLKLNVGFNRKMGEAHYGSRGASVNLELELDSGLVDHPDRLQERIRQLFTLARTSVRDELQSASASDGQSDSHEGGHTNGNGNSNGNGRACRNGGGNNGHASRSQGGGVRPATQSQVRAIHAIADRLGFQLAKHLQADFGVDSAAQLLIGQASQLIDRLKGQGRPAAQTTGGRR